MVIATYGKGTYVDTGYVWFRQLPAGIPGAFRIFANLISLPRAPKLLSKPHARIMPLYMGDPLLFP